MGAVAYLENIEKTIDFAVQHNLSIFPLYRKTEPEPQWLPKEKWTPYQTKRATLRQMVGWIEDSTKGMGLVTGKLNGIVVLDIDVKNGKNGWKYVKGKHLPPTPTVKTQSGGTHFYFKYPQNVEEIRNAVDLYGKNTGVDVRGDGGFVVMPFTPGYEWVDGLDFESIPLADIPEWLLNDLQKQPKKEPKQASKPRKTVAKVRKELTPKKPINPIGESVKDYFKDDEAVMQMLLLLGLEGVEIDGSPFNCILPSKTPDSRPSASLHKANNGVIVYRDWRASEGEELYYTLPEVYASLKYKEKKKLNPAELATWSLRMLVEIGILETTPIEAPELPESLRKKKAVNTVYEAFKHLLAVKKLYLDDQNRTAFSYRFGSAWCGLALRSVQNAMTQLEAFGYIQMVGKEGRGGRAVNVYQLNKQKH